MLPRIKTSNYNIYFNDYRAVIDEVQANEYSKIFILCDTNTHNYCVYTFLEKVPFEAEIIEMEAGELHKNLNTCQRVWEALAELGCDRHSLLINIGGGVVTDLGGFVASCYQRGIDYINIPTSLLAMVDASVGGKTGVDLGCLKNQVGVINHPKCVFISTEFLDTLPNNQWRSGLAEMIKHGIIADPSYLQLLESMHSLEANALPLLIHRSVEIKNEVVEQDPKEKYLRKILNFGHTIGHAIESYCLNASSKHIKPLLHGEAVAMGMIIASNISSEQGLLSLELCNGIKELINNYFPVQNVFNETDITQIISLLKHDKKAKQGEVRFVLISDMGKPLIDQVVKEENILKAFEYYYA